MHISSKKIINNSYSMDMDPEMKRKVHEIGFRQFLKFIQFF